MYSSPVQDNIDKIKVESLQKGSSEFNAGINFGDSEKINFMFQNTILNSGTQKITGKYYRIRRFKLNITKFPINVVTQRSHVMDYTIA